jgi:hypothetical protein
MNSRYETGWSARLHGSRSRGRDPEEVVLASTKHERGSKADKNKQAIGQYRSFSKEIKAMLMLLNLGMR